MKRKLPLNSLFRRWLRLLPRIQTKTAPRKRGPIDHVVILDGTMSSLTPGRETNAGLAYRLLCDVTPDPAMSIMYEQGVQWERWRDALDVVEGRGLDQQIRGAYGFIASRYRNGDRIFLFGYSRGAFGVRSLAGVIDQIGLLKAEHATVRNIRQIYRHYQNGPDSDAALEFARDRCHPVVQIEMVGVWDTVKSLGIRLPYFWRFSRVEHEFHDHRLGASIHHGFHALAMDETRDAYAPVLWQSREDWPGVVEQMWFRGTHGDIGGQLDGYEAARPLANISLVWMMEKAESCGLKLPEHWQDRFICDPNAPSVGRFYKWSKMFWFRNKRLIGRDPSEHIHSSVTQGRD